MSHIDNSVAKNLKDNKRRILEIWEQKVRARFTEAQKKNESVLLDDLPEFLDVLAEALSESTHFEHIAYKVQTPAEKHGRQRARLDEFSLDQVLDEYEILREVLFEILEEKQLLKSEDRDVILKAIQLGLKSAASHFFRDREQNQVAELLRSKELLRALVYSVEDYAIFTLDTQGYVTTWNQGATRMKEYKPEEIIGRHFSILYTEDAQERGEAMLHLRQAEERGRFRGEGMRVKKSGTPFLADVLITPLYENGKLIGFGKVVADLTERTRLIQERDMSKSKVETLEADRDVREQFVASLSHDLRTPLAAARMGAQLLTRQQQLTMDNVNRLSMRIIDNVDRADKLIQNLLDVNRVKAGEKLPLNVSFCNLNQITQNTLDELTTVYGDRFVLLSKQNIEGYWDAIGIRRILENLCTNAIKYGARNSPVTVTLIETPHQAQIAVHNYGNPIPPDEQDQLFEKFIRSPSAQVGSEKGWGLGLTLVRGIAEAHGGRIRVESIVEGTTFKVDLPLDTRAGQKDLRPKPISMPGLKKPNRDVGQDLIVH
jgi:PAS domain S-box-containing protein